MEAVELRLRLSRDCSAQVVLRGTVTREAIAKLVALLELESDCFPSEDEPKDIKPPPRGPRPAPIARGPSEPEGA